MNVVRILTLLEFVEDVARGAVAAARQVRSDDGYRPFAGRKVHPRLFALTLFGSWYGESMSRIWPHYQ